MNTPSKEIAYAAHKLRIGNYYISYPLVHWEEERGWQVDLFRQEVAKTIFMSGIISLRSPSYPETTSVPEQISLEDGKKILATIQDWELYL